MRHNAHARAARARAREAHDIKRDKDTVWGKQLLAIAEEHGTPYRQPSRPGRRGHPDEFYDQIAARYQALALAGEPHPVKRIAAEMHNSPHTASGWVRRCRQLGKLPPAQTRSRPGTAE